MAAGYQLSFNAVNDNAAQLCVRARELFDDVVRFKAQLDGIADTTLTAAPINMVQADVNDLRSAMSDLAQLATLWHGTATLAVAKDFTTFTKRLTGVI